MLRLGCLLADLLNLDCLSAFEINDEEPDDAEIFDLDIGLHVAERDARIRRPGAGGARRSHKGRALFGVDGDGAAAGALGEDRGGEPEGTAADDGDVAFAARHGLPNRDAARAPGQ